MFLRLLCVLVLISLGTGTVWYIFRETPQKKIERWRETSEVLFKEQRDIEEVEELNRKILELVPHSVYDLVFKAALSEQKGTAVELGKALAIYDGLIARGDPRLAGICLKKSRVLRGLGRNGQAQAVARSIFDALPFEATMELGAVAMARRDARQALLYFTQALHYSGEPLEKVRSREGQASAYWLAISAARSKAPDKSESDEIAELVRSCREVLRQAYETLVELEETPDTKQEIRMLLTHLADKRAHLRTSEESVYWDTAQILRERVKQDEKHGSDVPPGVYAQLGNLFLQTLYREVDALDDQSSREIKEGTLRDAAHTYFIKALGDRSPVEGKALILSASNDLQNHDSTESQSSDLSKSRHEYVLNLLGIAKVYLASTEFETVLQDASELALATRISAAIESPDPEVAGSFSVITAFAHLKAGEETRARELLDSYLASLPGDTVARAAFEVAARCHRMAPESTLLFTYLDAFEKDATGPLHLASRRLRLLEEVRENSEVFGQEASRRLEKLFTEAERSARTVEERVYLAELLIQAKGYEAAIESVLRSPEDLRTRSALHQTLASLLTERGLELVRDEKPEAAFEIYQSALAQYLKLFIRAPIQSHEVTQRTVVLLRSLESEAPEFSLEPLLRGVYPDVAHADRERFGTALKHFLLGEFQKSIDVGNDLEAAASFEPFWSYLTGTCHLQVSEQLRRAQRDEPSVRQELARARAAFESQPEFAPNEVELVSIELRLLDPGVDVSDELLKRIEALKDRDGVFEANWLLAQGLDRRFRIRYPDRDIKNSKLTRVLQRRRSALREVIRQRPRFTPAYIALADSFLISERLDEELRTAGNPLERKLYHADYDRALRLLGMVPAPDLRVFALAATYASEVGKPQDARRYLEALCLVQPTSQRFTHLLTNYLSSGTNRDVELVLGEREEIALTPSAKEWKERLMTIVAEVPELGARLRSVMLEIQRIETKPERGVFREALLSVLREKFVELSDHEGLARTALGQMHAVRTTLSRLDSERQDHRMKAIETYEEAVRAYDELGTPVPLLVLNNLAWILVDGVEVPPAELGRGLEVAQRARDALDNVRRFPDVVDTYAWALYRNRRLIEAEAELRGLLKEVESPTYRYHLACVLAEMKRFGDAYDEARRAVDSTASFPEEDEARALMSRMRKARIQTLGETAMSTK